jgi:hypothetical protein
MRSEAERNFEPMELKLPTCTDLARWTFDAFLPIETVGRRDGAARQNTN